MGLWYRVFGRGDTLVQPADVLAHLKTCGAALTASFDEETDGWFRAALTIADTAPLCLDRFPSSIEGIRAELNSWAAYLETCDQDPHHVPLMEQVIQTKQLFTLHRPLDHVENVLVEHLCVGLCQLLARATDGVYQIDEQGFFAADGTLLLREY